MPSGVEQKRTLKRLRRPVLVAVPLSALLSAVMRPACKSAALTAASASSVLHCVTRYISYLTIRNLMASKAPGRKVMVGFGNDSSKRSNRTCGWIVVQAAYEKKVSYGSAWGVAHVQIRRKTEGEGGKEGCPVVHER